MDRCVCIHGHFYQPPRENPWLDVVEMQSSAYPCHDWNERITLECYGPNTASRILDGERRIVDIINNYSRISFDFGPTLLSWIERNAPHVYEAILQADRLSRERFSGHGSALAHAYNHVILPLANPRDRHTQICWGIRDFERRFGRKPEGFWLPETAVDLPTLEALAEQEIRFTVLSPHQAKRVRLRGAELWKDVTGEQVDPRIPYLIQLPSGRSLSLFFYDGRISRSVAFGPLLERGEDFAAALTGAFPPASKGPQLVNIATDGETYGHHRAHGDMALAYALHRIETEKDVELTVYGEYLEEHPPEYEVEIVENTSWSCMHGVERWRAGCGCSVSQNPQWNQDWRSGLRSSLDGLRDSLASLYESKGAELLRDPWRARNEYVRVILDRSKANVGSFLGEQAHHSLNEEEKIHALKLLEMQRHAQLMYTSCGWYFDDLSGIEGVQVLQYAARAIQLAEQLTGASWEGEFLSRLEHAKSNIPEHGTGRTIYEKWIRPAMVDLPKVAAHVAISSLFENHEDGVTLYGYSVDREKSEVLTAGKAKLGFGRMRVTSQVTRESASLSYGVLHFGDHHVHGGVRPHRGEDTFRQMAEEVASAFSKGDLSQTLRVLDRHFIELNYSLRSLFRDDQFKIMNRILEDTLGEAETAYTQLYEDHAPMLRFLGDIGMPLPKALMASAEFVINSSLRRSVERRDIDQAHTLLKEAKEQKIPLDEKALKYSFEETLETAMEDVGRHIHDHARLDDMASLCRLMAAFPFEIKSWRAENTYFRLYKMIYPAYRERLDKGDATAREWVELFLSIGRSLKIRVD